MKIEITILIISLFIGKTSLIAQTNFDRGFKEGFKNGFCYSPKSSGYCNLPITPLPPIPHVNESKDNYQDGYNRGFMKGQKLMDLKYNFTIDNIELENELVRFNNYIAQNPVNAMVRVGMYKQALYDARKNWIQGRIDSLRYLLDYLTASENLPPNVDELNLRESMWEPVVRYSKQMGPFDFADDYVFRSVINKFDALERSFYQKYNYAVLNK